MAAKKKKAAKKSAIAKKAAKKKAVKAVKRAIKKKVAKKAPQTKTKKTARPTGASSRPITRKKAAKKKAAKKAPTRKTAKKAPTRKAAKKAPTRKAAKKAPTRKAAKKRAPKHAYTYSPDTGRWRDHGRFSPPPRRAQLATDSRGRPRDASGRLVPLGALAGPGRRVLPGTRPPKAGSRLVLPRIAPPVWVPPTRIPSKGASVEYIAGRASITNRRLMTTWLENRRDTEYAGDILSNFIAATTFKSHLAADDVTIYRHGIRFVDLSASPADLPEMANLVRQIAADYPEFSYQFSDGEIHVFLGDNEVPVSRKFASNNLDKHGDALKDIYNRLYDYWEGDMGWFVEIENDEIEGPSG